MKITVVPETLIFGGELDELSKGDQIQSAYQDLIAKTRSEWIKLDFSNVKRANSSGIVTWLKFMHSSKDHFEYVNCPVWLVHQFNMIPDFLRDHTRVTSINSPFFCEELEACRNVKMVVGEDIPLLKSYKDYVVENRVIDGKQYEPDFDPATYFSFLEKILTRY